MQLFEKIKKYIIVNYIRKYIDNKYWKFADNRHDKVSTLLFENNSGLIEYYFPKINLKELEIENPESYKFLLHISSKYIYVIQDCIIDPDFNWVILNNKEIFLFSYPLVEDPWDGVKARPSLINKVLNNKFVVIDKAILVKYLWNNYYHFLIDTITQIYLCDENGIDPSIPIIVPYNYNNNSYVTSFLKEFPISRKIIVQEIGMYIKVKELIVAKDTFISNYIKKIRAQANVQDLVKNSTEIDAPALIFITRKKGYRRTISNIEEIENIVKDYGFVIIEPINYTWIQQVILFSQAKKIIGIHGAGLTNMIFCKNNDLSVFEILPGKGIAPDHYANISKLLQYKYMNISGDGLDEKTQFYLNKDLFMEKLNEFMNL